MKLLFLLAALLCISIWAVSVFVYGATDLIHSLIAFTVIFGMMATMKTDQAIAAVPVNQEFSRG